MKWTTNLLAALLFASSVLGSPSKILWQAVYRGDLESVQHSLSKGVNPNFFAADGTTPLWQAAYLGFDQIVWILLKHGADPLKRPDNVVDDASNKGRAGPARLNPHNWLRRKSSSESSIPLPKRHSMALSGSLIQERTKGLDSPRAAQESKRSGSVIVKPSEELAPFEIGLPLHAAITKGHLEVIKLLMQHGDPQQVEEQNAQGDTPVHLACAAKDLRIFDAVVNVEAQKKNPLLLEHLRVARVRANHLGYLPLHVATKHGGSASLLMAIRLLQTGDDIHSFTRDEEEHTPFSLAQECRENAIDKNPRCMEASSRLMLLLAVYSPEVSYHQSEHLSPRLISRMILNLRESVSDVIFSSRGDEDPLEAMLRGLVYFYEEEDAESSSSSSCENSLKGSGKKVQKKNHKKKGKKLVKKSKEKKKVRQPSFYDYDSELEIRGESD